MGRSYMSEQLADQSPRGGLKRGAEDNDAFEAEVRWLQATMTCL